MTAVIAACFIGGLAAGHAIARWTSATPETPASGGVGTADERSSAASVPEKGSAAAAAVPAEPRTAAPPAAPLPPRDQPITLYYDELAKRAAEGDGAAARRLADDLYECATRDRQLDMAERLLDRSERGGRGGRGRGGPDRMPGPGPGAGPRGEGVDVNSPEFADRRLNAAERFLENAVAAQARCEGVKPETLAKSSEWIREAALAGDAEAQLCYAIAPNEWNRDVLSPEWVDWAERWNAESPALVRQAFEGGLPEAAAVLSNMYSAWAPRDARPWSERLGDDPYWAYAYAVIAQQTLSADQSARWSEIVRSHAARLNAEQVARADAWAAAARSRIRFQPPVSGPTPDNSLCGNIRRAGSR
ncbi:MAG TPA: hypothetical protein VLF18_01670 [Tahibacter sp.]|uniref:hypothetical protein n=1 Tax=Tahibacter sp. TaxID=2056211 RepID=UPI002C18C9E4|nr:hypothetical protein [Tahibacter sp.]HSX58883.1 hypothetical protein [Tahibacter sp.]